MTWHRSLSPTFLAASLPHYAFPAQLPCAVPCMRSFVYCPLSAHPFLLVRLGLVSVHVEVSGGCGDAHPRAVQLLGGQHLAAQPGAAKGDSMGKQGGAVVNQTIGTGLAMSPGVSLSRRQVLEAKQERDIEKLPTLPFLACESRPPKALCIQPYWVPNFPRSLIHAPLPPRCPRVFCTHLPPCPNPTPHPRVRQPEGQVQHVQLVLRGLRHTLVDGLVLGCGGCGGSATRCEGASRCRTGSDSGKCTGKWGRGILMVQGHHGKGTQGSNSRMQVGVCGLREASGMQLLREVQAVHES